MAVGAVTTAPELASFPVAPPDSCNEPVVAPAVYVQVKVAACPAGTPAEAGVAPVPVFKLAVPALPATTEGVAGVTASASAPPRLVTVIVTVKSLPAATEGGIDSAARMSGTFWMAT